MEEQAVEATFCFVDVAGFTALTEAHGDVAAADLVEHFGALVRSTLAGEGRLIDAIGDAVLISFGEPVLGVEFVSRLFEASAEEADFPALRAGLHHGRVVERDGRHFGAALNLAARVAGQAHGGQVLATEPVAEAARSHDIEVSSLGSLTLRNVRDPIELFSLGVSPRGSAHVVDPVCRMRVRRDSAKGRLQYTGKDYWFCSLGCAEKFASDPGPYVRSEVAP